jgi:protein subunit release factor B
LSSGRGQLLFFQQSRTFSSKYGDGKDAKDLDAARKWFGSFNEATIPTSISHTDFSKSSGPGGQKTNKYASEDLQVVPFADSQTGQAQRQQQSGHSIT